MQNPLPTRILVPVDVGNFSRRPFDLAVQLAKLNGADLVLLAVVEDTFPYPDIFSFHSPNEDYYRSIRSRALTTLQEVVDETPSNLKVEIMVSRGRPARVIVDVAAEEKADLIIMNTHGTRGLEHAILGSVTDKVLRMAPCPVLVIPLRRRKAKG